MVTVTLHINRTHAIRTPTAVTVATRAYIGHANHLKHQLTVTVQRRRYTTTVHCANVIQTDYGAHSGGVFGFFGASSVLLNSPGREATRLAH